MSSSSLRDLPRGTVLATQAWQLFQQRLPVLLSIIFIPTVLQLFLAFLLIPNEGSSLFSLYGSGHSYHTTSYFSTFLHGLLFGVLSLLLTLWSQVALIKAIKDSPHKTDVAHAFHSSLPYLTAFWWVSFLVGLSIFAGLFIFIVGALLLASWYGLSPYLVIDEGVTGLNALRRSRTLARGKEIDLIFRFIYAFFLFLLYILFLSILSSILGKIAPSNSIFSLAQLVKSIGQAGFIPFMTCYFFILLKHLQAQSEEQE